MPKSWTFENVMELARSFQTPCVLAAAADLDLFGTMGAAPFSAADAARKLQSDPRGMAILLDALAALQLLDKQQNQYQAPPGLLEIMTAGGPRSFLAMAQHQANCLRRWAHLAKVVKTGKPAMRDPSIRGEAADYASFIEAMDNLSGPMAARVIGALPALAFRHLLDVGGASGSWTIAFLRANPSATATIFDLPQVIPQAQTRLASAGLAQRVRLVGGDFYTDPLPPGADLAWVSAIIHQNSRDQNRKLFASVCAALAPGGQILIRDHLMESSRTAPVAGALFAVNMLVGTEAGGTYTFDELREDLAAAGFSDARILRKDDTMNCVVAARKA